jgi:basic membrane lipoprotein Med (substrate-binding protein (PBP1-ABC) superfamily)
LLTDAQGLTGAQAAPVWAGMQDASLATRAKVSYLPVTGAQTRENAAPFLAGLLQRHCDVVIAVGDAQASAVAAAASEYPKVRFVVVGGEGVHGANVTPVPAAGAGQVRSAVGAVVSSVALSGKVR